MPKDLKIKVNGRKLNNKHEILASNDEVSLSLIINEDNFILKLNDENGKSHTESLNFTNIENVIKERLSYINNITLFQ